MDQNSTVVLGLMRLKDISIEELEKTIFAAYEMGIRELDIADIYCRGLAEEKLGQVFARNPGLREKFYLQSKVGIVKDDALGTCIYDFSKEHILEGVNASLKRLNTTYLDSLLLHRPDVFADAKEIAQALLTLKSEAKVHHFGFSNFPISLIEYVQQELKDRIKFETGQYQLGLGHCALWADVFNENNINPYASSLDPNLYFYLKSKNIALEAWSPMQVGLFKSMILKDPQFQDTQAYLETLANKYHVTPAGILHSFVTTPWNKIRVITGSMNPKHIQEAVEGAKIKLTKVEWYSLYKLSKNLLP